MITFTFSIHHSTFILYRYWSVKKELDPELAKLVERLLKRSLLLPCQIRRYSSRLEQFLTSKEVGAKVKGGLGNGDKLSGISGGRILMTLSCQIAGSKLVGYRAPESTTLVSLWG